METALDFSSYETTSRGLYAILAMEDIPEQDKPAIVGAIIEASVTGRLRGNRPHLGEQPLYGTNRLAAEVVHKLDMRVECLDRILELFKEDEDRAKGSRSFATCLFRLMSGGEILRYRESGALIGLVPESQEVLPPSAQGSV